MSRFSKFLKRAACPCSLLMAALLLFSLSWAAGKYKTFTGSYFSVQYPATFKVQAQKAETVDSAVFTAPDGNTEFYIFSPLWNGEPKEIEPKPTEEVVTQSMEEKAGVKVRRMTLKAKDSSYTRSFEDRENTNTNNRSTFGFKYKDQKAYEQYKSDYLNFKQSWKAWAD